VTATDTHRAIDAVWRIESPRLIAGLARIVRDVGLAEELAQDALVTALERWPQSGIPDNPGAWLMAAAKNRALDSLRRKKLLERKHEEIGRDLEVEQETGRPDLDAALDDAREQKRRLDAFDRRNTDEHRLMQTQIDDVDSRLPPRRRPRRPS